MLTWFEKHAPIRKKFDALLLAFAGLAIGNIASAALVHAQVLSLGSGMIAPVVTGFASIAILFTAKDRICRPYVNTVVRMEALADGDTESPFRYSDHTDCVGRMTVAMETFRTALRTNAKSTAEEQKNVVDTLSHALERLAKGDLVYRIETDMPGEHSMLRDAYNASIAKLANIMADVRAAAQSVGSGASEIRAASDDLAQRNEEQASNLDETVGSMHAVTDLVQQSAQKARSTHEAMSRTHDQAQEGGAVVTKAVEAMAQIEGSANEITQIIDVIDGIAFQTNLLALNAGVEAARAGEAGKGFAVVANEVRALAQRSAEAANDIKELIGSSTRHVGEGVTLVDETGTLLSAIVSQIGEVTQDAQEMAGLAASQASTLAQVNKSVDSMNNATQRNAAMVEESTAAARSLAQEADLLRTLVSQFQTDARVPREPSKAAPPRKRIASSATRREDSVPAARAAPRTRKSTAKARAAPAASSAPAEPTSISKRRSSTTQGNLALQSTPAASTDEQDWSEF